MEQLEQNQAAFREDIDSVKGNVKGMKDKMDQLTCTITNMMERDNEANNIKNASTYVRPLVDRNPLQGLISDIQHTEADTTKMKMNVPPPKLHVLEGEGRPKCIRI